MSVPNCLLYIPDGNRRWAKRNGCSVAHGHTLGLYKNCARLTSVAFELGVSHVVLFWATSLNLQKRHPGELRHIFHLLRRELNHQLELNSGPRFHLCGDWERYCSDSNLLTLAEDVRLCQPEEALKHLTILFGYDGRADVLAAARSVARTEDEITSGSFAKRLLSAHIPDVDLMVRTGVEEDPHFSGLPLPWQMSNTQFYFTSTCAPEFTAAELEMAFAAYARRERRLGA